MAWRTKGYVDVWFEPPALVWWEPGPERGRPPQWTLTLPRTIDEAGLDYIGIQDHPYNSTFLETWTLIATLTQATQRVRFFPNVANLPLRPPAMLAKAAASLDLLSGGRVELSLGAGAFFAA